MTLAVRFCFDFCSHYSYWYGYQRLGEAQLLGMVAWGLYILDSLSC